MSTLNVDTISNGTLALSITDITKGNARAWGQVNTNGNLNSSFNISGSIDKTTGKRTFVFTNAMPSNAYCVVAGNAGSENIGNWDILIGNKATTSFLATIVSGSGALANRSFDFVVFAQD